MGAFNTVTATTACRRCNTSITVPIQFKYGDTWQHDYTIGDELRWGGNDIGAPGQAHVVVDGIAAAPCPNCGYDDEWHLVMHVRKDRITSIENATGAYDFVKEGRTYIVLRE